MRFPFSPSTFFRALVLLALCLSPTLLDSQAINTISANLSTSVGPYGDCSPANHAGVKVCFPLLNPTTAFNSPIASPFQVVGIGTGGGGPVQRIELWSDGKKVTQVYSYTFDQAIKLPIGVHSLTLVEVDSTGSFAKSTSFAIDVQRDTSSEFCSAPSSPGVHVCEPFSTVGCHTAPYSTFVVTGKAASGYVVRMELWVGNTKLANFPGNKINTSFYIFDFTQVTFIEVDSNGGFIKSPVYTIEAC